MKYVPTTNTGQRNALVCLILGLVTFYTYYPAVEFDFVQYDDPDYVSENSTVRAGLSCYGFVWSFVDAHAGNWHPLTWLSHMLDCQLFGLNPGAHHVVNIVLHSVNAALLFLLLHRTTGAVWRSSLVAALFAWHPLRVESVAWISERKDVLSGFFFMLTLLAYARYARTERPREAGLRLISFASRWYVLALSLFVLGLLSKPMLVTMPLVLLILDYWPFGRFHQPASVPRWCRIPKGLLIEKIPFFALSMLSGVITIFAQKSGGAVISLKSEGLTERLNLLPAGCLGYLCNIFWPHELSFLYLRPQHVSLVPVALGSAVLLVLSWWACSNSRHRPYLIVGWLWFLVMLFPVSSIIQVGLQSIADRYTYLPAIGLGLMVVWGGSELATRSQLSRRGRILALAGTGATLFMCLALTRQQLAYWRNTETLMQHALAVDPRNYVAHQDLAVYYSKAGRLEAAKEHRELVRQLDPALATSGAAEGRPNLQSLPSGHE